MVCFSYFFSSGRRAAPGLVQAHHHAVHPGPGEPLDLEFAEQFRVLALAPAYHRGEHLEPGGLVELEHPVHDLLRGLPGDRPAADRAVRLAHPRVQQPQVVVDLGDGPDGRPRVAAGRLLVDGHRRGQPVDEVHVGLVHLAEELAGIRRQRLHVPALALGEDGVERQAGLAGAGQPGEHDHRVPGQVERHVLEVVLARPAHNETISHSALLSGGSGRGQGDTSWYPGALTKQVCADPRPIGPEGSPPGPGPRSRDEVTRPCGQRGFRGPPAGPRSRDEVTRPCGQRGFRGSPPGQH